METTPDEDRAPASIDHTPTSQLRKPTTWHELFSARGGHLLVLRAFLGVTFTFAGLQKLANADFFRASAPGSFEQQVRGAITTSPLHHLLDPALHASVPVALVISFAELAVGVGTLLGFFTRTAAIGGMLLALVFFLTVSFNDSPYYYGPDIVFFFAWTPLAMTRPGTWSIDEIYTRRRARARADSDIERAAMLERRTVLQRGVATGLLALSTLALGGIADGIGRAFRGRDVATGSSAKLTSPPAGSSGTSGSPTSSSDASGPSNGTDIGAASAVPVGGGASFNDPVTNVPGIVVQPERGEFIAFSAICPHAGCVVAFNSAQDLFVCPCHGSTFNGRTGAVIQGPATTGLTPISVELSKGDLYVVG